MLRARARIRGRRTFLLAAVMLAAACAAPVVAIAGGGSSEWCTGCLVGNGSVLYWSTYHSELNNTQAWDYSSAGAGNCAGVWETSTNSYAAVECHAPTSSGPNTTTCSVANGCMSGDLAGHAAVSNYNNGGAWYFDGWAAWDA
jgi:hypothetical protein